MAKRKRQKGRKLNRIKIEKQNSMHRPFVITSFVVFHSKHPLLINNCISLKNNCI